MTNNSQAQTLPVSKNLQRVFESAVRDIYEVSITGKASRSRTPIARRVSVSSVHEEKRALSDAAKALAQLWRVSPNSVR